MLGRCQIKATGLYCFLLIFCQINILLAQDTVQELDSFLTGLHKEHKLNGILLLAKKGEVVFRKAYGTANFEKDLPITSSTPFNLASVAKQFTAMALMILAEQGKVMYDDPITKYLTSLDYHDITVRHLLNHQGGLVDYVGLFSQHDWDRSKIAGNEDLIALLAEHRPKTRFEAGSRFEYSNTGYILLGSIVEKASGQTFTEFLEEYIFIPLGMKNSFAYNLKIKDRPSHMAMGYRIHADGYDANDLIYLDGVMGDGNVYSSADDLFIWDRALYTEKLVRKETLKEAFTPGSLNDGTVTEYGFGWGVSNNGNTVSHGGRWVGFRSLIRRDLDTENTIIFLDNGSLRGRNGLMEAINSFMNNDE